jgi:hypothetical protein
VLFRYDPQNDPFRHLNDPALLDNTPIGTLRVVPWARVASVAVMDKADPTIVRRLIRTLHVGENPLDAVYGKRTHESGVWAEVYAERDEIEAKAEANEDAAISKDTVRDLDKLESRREDGAEAVAAMLGLAPWEVKD